MTGQQHLQQDTLKRVHRLRKRAPVQTHHCHLVNVAIHVLLLLVRQRHHHVVQHRRHQLTVTQLHRSHRVLRRVILDHAQVGAHLRQFRNRVRYGLKNRQHRAREGTGEGVCLR